MFNAKFCSADEVYESIYKQAKSSIYVVDNQRKENIQCSEIFAKRKTSWI